MTDLSPEAKELLRQARTAFSPPGGRLEAVRSAIQAHIAAFPGATPSPPSPASGVATRAISAAGWGTGHTVGSVLLIGALGAGGLAAWATADRAPPRPSMLIIEAPARTQPTGPIAPAEPTEDGELAPAPPALVDSLAVPPMAPSDLAPKLSPVPRDRPRGAARTHAKVDTPREAPVEPPAAVTDSLAEEVRLLQGARSALDRGEGAQALRFLNEHEKRFQRGTLYEERLATRVQALCALGFIDGARSTAQELERAAPRSPHLARVRASCIAQPIVK